ncbi:hypothetical protein DPMN_002825 [Dreissena polymorpha]|uniref:Uncharacterized protein n=1 Tax=Dreissena polymorpha TaxID=45954 RepID=A0A9D4RS41_DREPO|nr:hypothetical protein DPMN_002825 [Dreissena polymorpha]
MREKLLSPRETSLHAKNRETHCETVRLDGYDFITGLGKHPMSLIGDLQGCI